MDENRKVVGTCPLCGGKVFKTTKGYRCENNVGEHPSCSLVIHNIIGNRKMSDNEIAELLTNRHIMLDGFATKEFKTFPTVLILSDDGSVVMDSKIATCPKCGGDVRVGLKAFNCSNHNRDNESCDFIIWRNIAGHLVTDTEVKEICEKGITTNNIEMFREDGSMFYKRLGLTPDKSQIMKI